MIKKLKVLIVEDEPIIRVFLKSLVKNSGHEVVALVANGEDALDIINTKELDLIFMDINIDGTLDGISVVRQMRTKSKPLIYFISAYNDLETIEDAMSTYAYSYITKPIKEEDIHVAFITAKKHANRDMQTDEVFLANDLIYSKQNKELYLENELVKLSKIEKKLIDLFMRNFNSIVTVETIAYSVWEGREVSLSTLRGAIAGLRKKLPSLELETNIGRGYILHSHINY